MRKISTGQPSTLGTYRKISSALGGADSKAVKFFDEKIAASPNGENEEVIASESQMVMLVLRLLDNVVITECTTYK